MKIFALVNQKGGVGKTTTALNLATCLAATEKRVLLLDLDPQGNATSGLGINKNELKTTSYDVLIKNKPLAEALLETKIPFLKLVPTNTQLAAAEIELVSTFSREKRLASVLSDYEKDFDYIFIDCPPSLGLLTVNALSAAQGILVPVQCEYYALEGLGELTQTIEMIQKHLNPQLDIAGIILTMFDSRNNLSRQVSEEVRGFFKDKVFQSKIPRNVKISESPSHGLPILLYDAFSKGAEAYMQLTAEFIQKQEGMATSTSPDLEKSDSEKPDSKEKYSQPIEKKEESLEALSELPEDEVTDNNISLNEVQKAIGKF